MIALLIFWALTATAVAGVFHVTLNVQRAHIELLESELDFAEHEIDRLTAKQKFHPRNRVFGGKAR